MNEWMSLEEYIETVEGKEMGIGNLTFRISSGLDLWSKTGNPFQVVVSYLSPSQLVTR